MDNKNSAPEVVFQGVDQDTVPMFDHSNGVVIQVPKADVETALLSRKYTLPKGVEVPLYNPDGELGTITSDKVYEALQQGYKLEAPDEQRSRLLEEQYGDSDLAAAAAGAARGLSFGLSDQALTKTGLVAPETLSHLEEANPVSSLAGEAVGTVAGVLGTGGAAGIAGTGVKAAAKAGLATEKAAAKFLAKQAAKAGASKAVTNSIVQKVVPKFAGSAVEGAAYGAGHLISEDALGRADFNAENLVASMGVGALLGGVVGGALGTAEVALDAAKPIISKVAKPLRDGLENLTDKNKAVSELLGMTKKETERVTRTGLIEELPQILRDDYGLTKVTTTDDLLGMVKSRKVSAGKVIGDIGETLEKEGADKLLAPEAAVVYDKIEKAVKENIVEALQDTVAGKGAVKQVKNLLADYETKYAGQDFLTARQMLGEMRALDDQLQAFYRDPSTTKHAIKAAYEVRTILREEINALADRVAAQPGLAPNIGATLRKANKDFYVASVLEGPLERKALAKTGISLKDLGIVGVGTNAGPTGVIGAAVAKFVDSDLRRRMVILSNIEKANLQALKNVKNTVKDYFSKTGRVAEKFTLYKLTDSVLSQDLESGKKPKSPKEAFDNIQKNLDKYSANPDALIERTNSRTAGIYAVAPHTSAAMDLTAQNAVQFLASKLPRTAQNQGVLDLMTNKRMPSTYDVAKFERYLKAVEKPHEVIKDLKRNLLTKESVEALKTVYPTLYEQLQTEVMNYISAEPEAIDYNSKVRLGVLLDMPTDISLIPENVLALQALHTPQPEQGGAGAAPVGKAPNTSERYSTSTQEIANGD
jgi:hypothetical protein